MYAILYVPYRPNALIANMPNCGMDAPPAQPPAMIETPAQVPTFEGLTVAAFESRREQEIAALISRFGGVPLVAPSMREVPLEDNSSALAFGETLIAGRLDAVIFMTGVGAEMLLNVLERRYPREKLIAALSKTTVIARGSKTVRALTDAGIPITIKVPEPNTWREIVQALDAQPQLARSRIAIQEYGESNDLLIRELRARGAEQVTSVPVYRWALPEDLAPLEQSIDQLIDGRARVVVFTNAVQVDHLLDVAARQGRKAELLVALERGVVCSIGPTCSETLAAHGIAVDVEPESHKMGVLVHEAARCAPALLKEKRRHQAETARLELGVTSEESSLFHPTESPRWADSRFMKACRREAVDATPVWLMRQAGRYMRFYRELRSRVPFLSLCKTPDLVAEVTVRAAHDIGADAAILFADLLLIAEPMGFHLDYETSGGPRVTPAVQTCDAVKTLVQAEPPHDALGYVFEAVRRTRAALNPALPLIGFAGAPFTLASYLIEGGPSRTFWHTKSLMLRDPGAWSDLLSFLASRLAAYINGQIEAGAQAVQVFDSWVGCLSPDHYRRFVLPHMKSFFRAITPGVPMIHFGTGTAALLELMREAGGSIIGVDYRVELDDAWDRLGAGVGVQGNLDPVVLGADLTTIRQHSVRILRQAGGRPGHIFNLGHGVLPHTPEERVIDLIKIVHEESARLLRL